MFITAIIVIVSGCTAGKEAQDNPALPDQQPAVETGSSTTPANTDNTDANDTPSTLPAPLEPAAGEPSTEGSAGGNLNVTTGETVEIDTMIEGMSEKVQVTEYTLTPYNIFYQMRTLMGEPTVKNGQVIYSSTIGMIALEIQENKSLDDAVSTAQAKFKDGYKANTQMDISSDVNGHSGMLQYYEKDGSSHGYKVYDINGDALIIYFSYKFEAADGMAAIFNEFETSIQHVK